MALHASLQVYLLSILQQPACCSGDVAKQVWATLIKIRDVAGCVQESIAYRVEKGLEGYIARLGQGAACGCGLPHFARLKKQPHGCMLHRCRWHAEPLPQYWCSRSAWMCVIKKCTVWLWYATVQNKRFHAKPGLPKMRYPKVFNVACALQVLQTLSIIIQNVRSETGIFFLFSNNHINNIVSASYDFEDEEVLGYYISFLKAISLKLNPLTVRFFLLKPLPSPTAPDAPSPPGKGESFCVTVLPPRHTRTRASVACPSHGSPIQCVCLTLNMSSSIQVHIWGRSCSSVAAALRLSCSGQLKRSNSSMPPSIPSSFQCPPVCQRPCMQLQACLLPALPPWKARASRCTQRP